MKTPSNPQIPSNKSIKIPTLKLITLKCKHDHLNYHSQLPIKKYLSSYQAAYNYNPNLAKPQTHQQELPKIIPHTLNQHQLTKSLHQTRHFSSHQSTHLPTLKINSTYKTNFLQKTNQRIIKAKQQQGFFIKMPWLQSPVTNYRVDIDQYKKSYKSVHVQNCRQKGKGVQDHLKVLKTVFKGKSIYDRQFRQLHTNQNNDDGNVSIKNKDHLGGKGYGFRGQSEYRRRYQTKVKSINKIKENTNKINTTKTPTLNNNNNTNSHPSNNPKPNSPPHNSNTNKSNNNSSNMVSLKGIKQNRQKKKLQLLRGDYQKQKRMQLPQIVGRQKPNNNHSNHRYHKSSQVYVVGGSSNNNNNDNQSSVVVIPKRSMIKMKKIETSPGQKIMQMR